MEVVNADYRHYFSVHHARVDSFASNDAFDNEIPMIRTELADRK
jgi:hypothetical protein